MSGRLESSKSGTLVDSTTGLTSSRTSDRVCG